MAAPRSKKKDGRPRAPPLQHQRARGVIETLFLSTRIE